VTRNPHPALVTVATLLYPLYDFCFTPSCFHCSARLRRGERRLCDRCWSSLDPLLRDDPLYRQMCDRICGDGLFDAFCALYRFRKEGALQTLLHELKYGGKTGVGEALGSLLGEHLRREGVLGPGAIVLPVPLHPVRQRERGYNQAEIISRGVATGIGGELGRGFCRRVRNTPTQTALGHAERASNVHGAFELRSAGGERLRGREILIVDDVITTGATLRACGAAVRLSGPGRLVACSVALAV
jgi:ComF family protein